MKAAHLITIAEKPEAAGGAKAALVVIKSSGRKKLTTRWLNEIERQRRVAVVHRQAVRLVLLTGKRRRREQKPIRDIDFFATDVVLPNHRLCFGGGTEASDSSP